MAHSEFIGRKIRHQLSMTIMIRMFWPSLWPWSAVVAVIEESMITEVAAGDPSFLDMLWNFVQNTYEHWHLWCAHCLCNINVAANLEKFWVKIWSQGESNPHPTNRACELYTQVYQYYNALSIWPRDLLSTTWIWNHIILKI